MNHELEDFSRRAFIVTSLTTGFALAVSPVSAQTITTDAKGLIADEVKIAGQPAYRAMPEGKGPFPLVLVVPEIFGVHEHIKDVCRRFAKAGYMAVAQELFARQGDVSKEKDFAKILDVVGRVPDAQVMSDLDAAVGWAKSTGKVDGDKIGITGFCWGGRIVWLYSAFAKSNVKAGLAWYGRISNAQNALQTKSPIDVVKQMKAPVLGLYGGKDTGIPVAHVEMMKKELAAQGKTSSDIIVYPDAQHAFFADYRPSYDKKAADDAWPKALAFLKKNGVG
jgi:carboxymethylenebutenolidase